MAVDRLSTVSSPTLQTPLLRRLTLSLVALLSLAAIADVLGIAGYRYGGIGLTVGLPVVAVLVAVVQKIRPLAWIVALAVLAAALGGLLVDRAPWSTGRLEAALDDLEHLDGFEVLETERTGHSWCRPSCPKVTRVYRAPDTSPKANVVTMAVSLSNAGLAPPLSELGGRILTDTLRVRGDETNVLVTAERLEIGDLRVTVVLSSHR